MSRPPIPGLKERIISVAREVFADKGYKGTTVREIARIVGVTVGVLYLYFENKEDIYLEALREGVRLYKEGISEVIGCEDPEVAIREYIKNHLEYSTLRKQSISLQFKDYDLEFARPFRTEFFSYQKEFLTGIIKKGVEQGMFCVSDCGDAALFILYVLKGAVFNDLAGTVNLTTAGDTLCGSVLSFLRQDKISGEASTAPLRQDYGGGSTPYQATKCQSHEGGAGAPKR
jgi:AcrR family transcriptional regulator